MNNRIKDGSYLFYCNEQCCGCGSCKYICPTDSIKMTIDENGFFYPDICIDTCINCKQCITICRFDKENNNPSTIGFAAINLNTKQIKESASGGLYSAIASEFVSGGNYAVGAVMDLDSALTIEHQITNNQDCLDKQFGSKYVQSKFWPSYPLIKEKLINGDKIVISGTPCQIDNARSVFRHYDDQVLYIDLICHGVPSQKMFQDYILYLQKKLNEDIRSFVFRDKTFGWGLMGSFETVNKCITFDPSSSSYYQLFLNGDTYRDCCYKCPYANLKRVGDLTIGDFWGIKKEYPNLLEDNGGPLNTSNGISCLLVNTEKGKEYLSNSNSVLTIPVDVNKIANNNSQLRTPVSNSKHRLFIFFLYRNFGYRYVDYYYSIFRFNRFVVSYLKKAIPQKVKNAIRIILKV